MILKREFLTIENSLAAQQFVGRERNQRACHRQLVRNAVVARRVNSTGLMLSDNPMLTQPQTFPCPNCNEIINDTMQTCRFCSAPVDPQAAASAAENQSRVNRACSDASFLRTAAAAMFVLLSLSVVPFISLITYLGFIVTFFVVLVLIIRWQINFGRLQTSDPDYRRAKRLRTVALILWLVAIPLFVIRDILVVIIARAFA